MTYSTEFAVRFGEIDYARVVYYPWFFHYFHQAFERWFEEALGKSYPDLVTVEDIGFPSVKIECDFVAPLRYGDRVRIEITLVDVGKKSLTLRYRAVRLPDGVECARATITTVAIHNDSFKSITIPDEWRERFERYRSIQGD